MTTQKTTKAPSQANASKATPPVATPAPVPATLTGVTIRADVLTYTPDVHKPRIQIKTPTLTYYKLVPGVTTTTKAEALTSAQDYRALILASGELPAPGVRKRPAQTPTPAEGQ